MNSLTVQFAAGGYILSVTSETGTKTDVFVSTGKLNKAIREAVAEFSLLPKKGDSGDAE